MGDSEQPTRYIYTTLDPDLQDAAEQAVAFGMGLVDAQLRKDKRGSIPPGQPQVALVALDPRTGEIKALVGGRNYAASQLNHALAMRQPGSVFKPIVYAAALETAISGGPKIFTPASILNDEPTTFRSGGQVYQPANFHNRYMGEVTLRTALAHSLNNATVELASQVGYARVVDMARRFGWNDAIQPTPAVALGAYENTPLEIAGAYSVFANGGERVAPTTISLVRGNGGAVVYQRPAAARRVLDPRVNYLMVGMLEDVLRYGTGASVRARGFNLPAAGKTGTSRDGWFAGFTTNLLCVVWVGFDDNRELNLEGSRSALPIWVDFMKRVVRYGDYGSVRDFQPPPGVVTTRVCAETGDLDGPDCSGARAEAFIDGTQPVVRCCRSQETEEQDSDRVVEQPETSPAVLAPAPIPSPPAADPPPLPAIPLVLPNAPTRKQ
jgi:penicillin-binding protein 1B